MKHIALIISILAISATAFAQTYSNANLNGSYSLQFGSPQTYNWSKTFTCPTCKKVFGSGPMLGGHYKAEPAHRQK